MFNILILLVLLSEYKDLCAPGSLKNETQVTRLEVSTPLQLISSRTAKLTHTNNKVSNKQITKIG